MNLMMDNRMKTMKYILAALLSAMALVSCNDWLTLGPIDYYGSESYWKTEANFDSYIDGMHKNMRDQAWTHTIIAGELRGGTHIDGTSSDGTSVSYADIITQTFDEDHTGLSNFGGYYGPISFKAKAAFNFMNQPFEYCDAGDYIYWMRSAYNNSHWANKATLSAVYPYGLGQTEVTNSTVWNILRKTDANSYLLQKGWSEMTDPVDGATKILYKSTNPADYNINNPTLTQDYTVSMSGGNDKGRYYASIGYNDANGLPVSTFYKRLSFLFNGSYNLNRWLTSNSSVNFVRALYRDMPGSFSGAGTGYDGYYFGRIMGTPPTVRFEDEDGNPLFGNSRSDGNQNYQPEKYIRDNENNKLTLSQGFSAKLSRTLTFNVNATWYYDQYVNEAFNKDLQNNQAGTAWVRTRSSSASYSRYFNQTYTSMPSADRTMRVSWETRWIACRFTAIRMGPRR